MHKSSKLSMGSNPDLESQDPPKAPVPAELEAELCADRLDSLYIWIFGAT